jgi:hypothetical protein
MGLSWMKSGAESAQLAQQDQVEHELRKDGQGKTYRWFLAKGEEDAGLTFVDGALSPEGYLLPPRYYEHKLFMNGSWNNHFVCPEKTNPEAGHKCPICEGGDRPTLVALFTVVDHRIFPSSKEGQPAISNRRKLFVAPPMTFETLNKIAMKRGGLAGLRFDVSRKGDKAAAVGDTFDFMQKEEPAALAAKYVRQVNYKEKNEQTGEVEDKTKMVCDYEVLDYEEEIVFRTPEELRALGFGKGASAPTTGGLNANATVKHQGTMTPKPTPKPAPTQKPEDTTNYEAML